MSWYMMYDDFPLRALSRTICKGRMINIKNKQLKTNVRSSPFAVTVSVSVTPCICLSLCLSFCLCVCLYLRVSPCLDVCFRVSISISICVTETVSRSPCGCLFISVSVYYLEHKSSFTWIKNSFNHEIMINQFILWFEYFI